MYRALLLLHWKQARLGLLPLVVACFGLPLLSVQGLGGSMSAAETLLALELTGLWLPLFPALAAATGVTVALTAWSWDHRLDHVYALSLPLPRWRYALLKMGAGATLLLLPVAAFWVGAHLAVLAVSVPDTLRAYPDALTLRFLLASLVAFAFFFALAAGTRKTTVAVLTLLVAVPVLVAVGDGVMSDFLGDPRRIALLDRFLDWLVHGSGPLRVFAGSWGLVDV